MWILATILAMIILTVVQIPMRTRGLTLFTYCVYALGVMGGTAWLLPYAIKNASSFTGYWFIAIGMLSVLGYLTGVLFFKETLTISKYAGITLCLAGSYLLK